MKLFLKVLTIFLILNQNLNSQFNKINNPSVVIGRGNVGVANYGVENSLLNPAAIVSDEKISILFYGSTGLYDLSDLKFKGLMMNYEIENSNLQIGINQFGYSKYYENQLNISFAKYFIDNLSVGINLNLQQLKIENYGNNLSHNFDVGIIYLLNDNIKIGVSNLNLFDFDKKINQPSKYYNYGINYEPIKKSFIEWNLISEADEKLQNRIGLQYEIIENLIFKYGIETNPKNIFLGLNLIFEFGSIDYAVRINSEIGNTNYFTICTKY